MNIMKTFKFLMPCLLVALAVTGCDTDDLRNDVDELKNRVESLEAQISAINENMNVLQVLIDGNKTIQSCTYDETNKEYKLVLSDGQELTLSQGANGVANVPTITIDETDNTWVVNGNDTGVKATGTDAATPQFSVSDDGYWMVDYDGEGGEPADYVKGADGNKVKANPSDGGEAQGDTFFTAVTVENGYLKVTLSEDGKSYLLPIVEGLVAEIVTTDLEGFKDGVLTVGYGATVKIPVKVTGESYFVTAPAGWIAQLSEPSNSEAIITLTAPAQSAAASRATADNTTDLTLQVNKGAAWAIDQIKVEAKVIIDSYYALYEAGNEINIEGVVISKAKYGDAVLVEDNASITKDKAYGVYFVKPGATLSYDVDGASAKHLIVIGDNEQDNTACFKLTKRIQTNKGSEPAETDGYFLWNNVKFDASSLTTQVMVAYINGDQGSKILFNKCMLDLPTKNFFELTNDARYFSDLEIKNSKIRLNGNMNLIHLGGSKCDSFGTLIFENNVFYTKGQNTILNNFKLVNATSTEAKFSNLIINNNTFINIAPNWSGMYYQPQLGKVDMNYNLFWYAQALVENGIILRPNVGDPATYPEVTCTNNIGFSLQGEKRWVAAFGEINKWSAEAKEIENKYGTSLDDDNNPFRGGTLDFENGEFVPNSTYAEYGAKFE